MAPATYKVKLTVSYDLTLEVTASSRRVAKEIALHEYRSRGERDFWRTTPQVVAAKVNEAEAGQ